MLEILKDSGITLDIPILKLLEEINRRSTESYRKCSSEEREEQEIEGQRTINQEKSLGEKISESLHFEN